MKTLRTIYVFLVAGFLLSACGAEFAIVSPTAEATPIRVEALTAREPTTSPEPTPTREWWLTNTPERPTKTPDAALTPVTPEGVETHTPDQYGRLWANLCLDRVSGIRVGCS